MKQHKILFVTASVSGGGAERMLFNIINSLDENHLSSLVITSDAKVPQGSLRKDIDVINLYKSNSRNAFCGIFSKIRNYKPDYVFTTSSTIGYMLIAIKLLLSCKFKVIIRCAVTPSEIVQTTRIKGKLLKYVIKGTYKWCDLMIAQTEFMRQDLNSAYHVPFGKIKTIRNIIDTEFLIKMSDKYVPEELNPNHYNIVAAGALYSIKGFDVLIKSIPLTIKANYTIHLYILGDERYEIGYKEFLQKMIDDNNLSSNIKLLGHKDNPYPYFKNANLFVMSSRKEGFPNVVLESLYLGTPVVVTDCVDFSGVIYEGINGYIVKKDNSKQLQEGIEKALKTTFDMQTYPISNFDYNDLFS